MKDLIEAHNKSSLIFFKLSSNWLHSHCEDTDTQLFKNLLHCLRGQTRNSNTDSLAMEAYEWLIEDWNLLKSSNMACTPKYVFAVLLFIFER